MLRSKSLLSASKTCFDKQICLCSYPSFLLRPTNLTSGTFRASSQPYSKFLNKLTSSFLLLPCKRTYSIPERQKVSTTVLKSKDLLSKVNTFPIMNTVIHKHTILYWSSQVTWYLNPLCLKPLSVCYSAETYSVTLLCMYSILLKHPRAMKATITYFSAFKGIRNYVV